jgi:hypothetical protein
LGVYRVKEPDWNQWVPLLAKLALALALVGTTLAVVLHNQSVAAVGLRLLGPAPSPSPAQAGGLPRLTLTVITSAGCRDCSNVSAALAALRTLDANITRETTLDFADAKAKDLLQRYRADRVPTILVQGDTRDPRFTRAWATFGVVREDGTVVFTGTQAPYLNVSTGKVEGLVTLTVLVDERCSLCPDYKTAVDQFRQVGLAIAEERRIDYNSTEGRALVRAYNLTKVPTVLLSPEAWSYSVVQEAWTNIGTREADGTLVLRQVNPPYRDLAAGHIAGLVTLVNVVDGQCTPCYDVAIHRQLFDRFGIVFKQEDTHDIASVRGRALTAQYNITKVPTVLLSPEASLYPVLTQIWSQLGTNESDGWLVFRNMEALPNLVYYDTLAGKIVGADQTGGTG